MIETGLIETYGVMVAWVNAQNWFLYTIVFFLLWFTAFVFIVIVVIVFRSEIWQQAKEKIFRRKYIAVYRQNSYGDMFLLYVPASQLQDGILTLEQNGEKEQFIINEAQDIYYIEKKWTVFLGYKNVAAHNLITEDVLEEKGKKKIFAWNIVNIKNLRLARIIDPPPLLHEWENFKLEITAREFQRHMNQHIAQDAIEATEDKQAFKLPPIVWVIIGFVVIAIIVVIIIFAKGVSK